MTGQSKQSTASSPSLLQDETKKIVVGKLPGDEFITKCNIPTEQSMKDRALFRIRKTVFQMIRDRGYAIRHEELNETFEQFMEKFRTHDGDIKRADLDILVTDQTASRNLLVYFVESEKFGIHFIETTILKLYTEKAEHCILISKKLPTAKAMNLMKHGKHECTIEHFLDSELMFNITQHELVPPHIRMSEDEKKVILEKYGLSENQLPVLLRTDPVAKYYGFEKGTLVRIVRSSEASGKYIYYRLVL
ncbi:hypothetical protein ACOME3_010799 [Neoechinorhynchus agilis]